jgi:hypothetical protein
LVELLAHTGLRIDEALSRNVEHPALSRPRTCPSSASGFQASPVTGWPGFCMSGLPGIGVDLPRLSTTRNEIGRLRNVAPGCEPARRPRIVP